MKAARTIILLAYVLMMALAVAHGLARVEIIVVHTGESKTLHYNPETHEVVTNEMADGNVMLTVQPKDQK